MSFPINLPAAFTSEQVRELREAIEMIVPSDLPAERMNSGDLARTLQDTQGGAALVIRLIELFCQTVCFGVARKIFGSDIAFLLPQCAFRFHQPGRHHSHLPFHLDAGFLGTDTTTLTFWVPLVDVGESAPSLTFLRPELDQNTFITAYANRARSGEVPYLHAEDVQSLYGKPADEIFTTPVLSAGSVSIFHHLTLHATQALDGGGAYRVSKDYRIASRAALPKLYLAHNLPVAIAEQRDTRWHISILPATQAAQT